MNGYDLRPQALAAACAAFLCLLAPQVPSSAQTRGPQPHKPTSRDSSGPPKPARPEAPSIRERQFIIREMEKEMSKPAPEKSAELVMAEIAEDYKRLQLINNKMLGKVIPSPAPDYKLIADSSEEIRRLAERLRDNLKLPEPASEAEENKALTPVETVTEMKKALIALDRSIMSFVQSPLFQNTEVLDAEAAAKASRDLADVIERSRHATKDAERLAKKR